MENLSLKGFLAARRETGGGGALMVAMAGDLGHDVVSFKQRLPDTMTRTAPKWQLQDQAHIVEEVERKGGGLRGEGKRCEVYEPFKPSLCKDPQQTI